MLDQSLTKKVLRDDSSFRTAVFTVFVPVDAILGKSSYLYLYKEMSASYSFVGTCF